MVSDSTPTADCGNLTLPAVVRKCMAKLDRDADHANSGFQTYFDDLQSRVFELETSDTPVRMEELFEEVKELRDEAEKLRDEAKELRDEAKELRDEVKEIRDEISRKRSTGGVDGIDDDEEEAQKSKRRRFDISEHERGVSIVFS
jgi:predicted nuclease with TOPRIM domain